MNFNDWLAPMQLGGRVHCGMIKGWIMGLTLQSCGPGSPTDDIPTALVMCEGGYGLRRFTLDVLEAGH
jgi:hypothetical protein